MNSYEQNTKSLCSHTQKHLSPPGLSRDGYPTALLLTTHLSDSNFTKNLLSGILKESLNVEEENFTYALYLLESVSDKHKDTHMKYHYLLHGIVKSKLGGRQNLQDNSNLIKAYFSQCHYISLLLQIFPRKSIFIICDEFNYSVRVNALYQINYRASTQLYKVIFPLRQ